MTEIHCANCHRPYPEQGTPFRCQVCGGYYDFISLPLFDSEQVDLNATGLWRYRHVLGLPPGALLVTLGEGNTPLEWREIFDRRVAFKLEYLNPTGSFKDRGSALLVSFLRARGARSAVEDSSGNAGASFAAYAAHAGMEARVFIPSYTSQPKRALIEYYGAEVVQVPGPRSETSEAVLRVAEGGAVYASHAYMPHGLPGYATIAYELFHEIGGAPGGVIAPVGQGNLLLAIGRGFKTLLRAGLIETMPRLVGVQALACAPLWAVFEYGAAGLGWVTESETLAEGVRVVHPLRGDVLLQMVMESEGLFVAVQEEDIMPGRDQLARLGFNVEPTSAILWSALEQVTGRLPDPLVVVLTGSRDKAR